MLISDRISKHVKDAIWSFVIKDWQWIDNKVKEYYSRNLNCWFGAPPEACLIMIRYTASLIMFRTVHHKLDLHTPLEALALTGQTPGISGMLHFVFWKQYLKDHAGRSHSNSTSRKIMTRRHTNRTCLCLTRATIQSWKLSDTLRNLKAISSVKQNKSSSG